MLVAIDVGDTVIALGLYEGERLAASRRLATRHDATADQVAVGWTSCCACPTSSARWSQAWSSAALCPV
jgi:pantothenate kinase type III